jgi:hypothetical protein
MSDRLAARASAAGFQSIPDYAVALEEALKMLERWGWGIEAPDACISDWREVRERFRYTLGYKTRMSDSDV